MAATSTLHAPALDGCPACGSTPVAARNQQQCPACGTVWMPSRRSFAYDDAYPEQRSHFDDAVARCKQRTLAYWVRRTGVALPGRRVLEVGFGSGATLAWLQGQGASVWGQEPVAANRASAVRLGIPAGNLGADLGAFAGQQFGLLLYLDAFEHILDPADHLRAVSGLTAPGSKALVVLPVAGSLSRRVLGRAWPHDVRDHWVFHSDAGLAALWGQAGWRVAQRFYPWKCLSLLTVAQHWRHKTGLPLPAGPLAHARVWLNFGERGFLFERV